MQADDVIARVEKRIAMVTHLPEANGEGLQILHYQSGQARRPCAAACTLGSCMCLAWHLCPSFALLLHGVVVVYEWCKQ